MPESLRAYSTLTGQGGAGTTSPANGLAVQPTRNNMKFKLKQRVRIRADASEDCPFAPGTVGKVMNVYTNGKVDVYVEAVSSVYRRVRVSDLEPVGLTMPELYEERKQRIEERDKAQAGVDEADLRIDFLESTGEKEFDEVTYASYRAILEAEKTSKPAIDRAKAIAQIVKSLVRP